MGNITNELTFGRIQLSFASDILHRHGDSPKILFSSIEDGIQQNPNRAINWLRQRNGKLGPFFEFTSNNLIQRTGEFRLNSSRESIQGIFTFDRLIPTKNSLGGGVSQQNLKIRVQ